MKRAAPLLAVGLSLGCFYPAERGRLLEAKVEKLSDRNQALEAELRDAREKLAQTLPTIDQKVKEVTEALEGLDKAARRTDADISVQIQKAVEDVAQLRGQVESYLHRISELENAIKSVGEQTEQKLLALQGDEALKAAEAKRKAQELERPKDKKEFLELADQKAKAGELALARQLYSEFLKKWPKDALLGEAHFGLGETYFSEDKCREALFEYGKVIQEHAKSRSAPTAYLRSSECFKKLKMNEEARLALEEVVKSYPGTEAAKTAKERLAQDKAKKAPPKKGKSR